MREKKYILSAILAIMAMMSMAQLNHKILNRPYADMKRIHFGFSVGMQVQDINFTHSGYINEQGEQWFMEIPDFSPGFNVSVLADLYINKYLNLRFSPGMAFGNKTVEFKENNSGNKERQDIKSYYVTLPLDLKVSAERYVNIRPYVVGGVMGTYDVAKKRNDYLQLKPFDFYLTVGIGCDFYLRYFKLIPELKFCFGLTDIINHNRPDLVDPADEKYTRSLKRGRSNMVILSFYFE